jgi:hypothetical protein
MNRQELVKAVMAQADSEVKTELLEETNANPTVEETTEPTVHEENNPSEPEATQKADVEKKTALQKRLDKLTREKFEAIERANELQRQLEAKSNPKEEIKSALEIDDETNAFLDNFINERVEKKIAERESLTLKQKEQLEQQQIANKFEEKLMLSLTNEFSEDTGEFSDKAKEMILTISDKFQKDPKWVLAAIDAYGIENAYKILTLSDLPEKQVEKKDSIDKLLDKERLMKTAKSSSSNVTQRIEKQQGETPYNFLKRTMMGVADKL